MVKGFVIFVIVANSTISRKPKRDEKSKTNEIDAKSALRQNQHFGSSYANRYLMQMQKNTC